MFALPNFIFYIFIFIHIFSFSLSPSLSVSLSFSPLSPLHNFPLLPSALSHPGISQGGRRKGRDKDGGGGVTAQSKREGERRVKGGR